MMMMAMTTAMELQVQICNNGITRMVIIDADDNDADWPRNKLIIYLIETFLDPWAQQTDKMPPS